MLEKEFVGTEAYVTIDNRNYNTFSSAFTKLILQVGSEADIAMKMLCQLRDPTFSKETIDQYQRNLRCYPEFELDKVEVKNTDIFVEPFKDWKLGSPIWWKVYNKIKHERTNSGIIGVGECQEYYLSANLKHTLCALAGLYQVLIYAFYLIANKEEKYVKVPLPASRLFVMTGNNWSNVEFYDECAFEIIEGNLNVHLPPFPY